MNKQDIKKRASLVLAISGVELGEEDGIGGHR
jgi:hypothetical protein